ncbi:Blackbeard [Chaetoceros tenuissimus]|uniref:Blackbeard n=1 Tax=Chaetoceros tenuissimus TaxID=426638 RepID=A0AAD3H4V0_9STRA|nr:Blackbeard [Chaetoceros tenuissimus]
MVLKKTTRGWELLVEWKDGMMSWVPLKDLKNSNPVELAQYAVMNALEEEPVFKWWVPYTLKKRDAIVAKVKSKYWVTAHKFGIRIPKSADEAYKLDADSKTTFWTDATNKEMENVRVAFEVLSGVTPEEMCTGKVRPGYKFIPCHMIFDIKMDGKFTRKARLVAGGHVTDPPTAITYSSIVSCDSVRISLVTLIY